MPADELHVASHPEAGSADGTHLRDGEYARAEGLPVPEGFTEGALYCVFPRVFSPEGTLAAIERGLDRIRDLGASTLWLLPIHPIGREGRKGSAGSPYSVADYRAVHPDLGTEDDLRSLVDAAHGRGLRVLIDYVANHAANDHPHRETYPQWFASDAEGRPARRVADWSDVADWRFDAPGAADYLVESALHWVRDTGIDGFRCDVAGMVPRSFWERLHRELSAARPDHLLLAEWQDARLHTVAFHASYDWILYRALRDTALGRKGATAVGEALETWSRNFPRHAIPLRFVENHDEPRAAAVFGRDRLPAYTAVAYLSGGWPLVYAGQEAGAAHRPSLFEREPVDFDSGTGSGLVRDLLAVRARSPWREGETAMLSTDRPETVVALTRRAGDREGVLVANLGRDRETVRVEIDGDAVSPVEPSPAVPLEPGTLLALDAGSVWIGERVR